MIAPPGRGQTNPSRRKSSSFSCAVTAPQSRMGGSAALSGVWYAAVRYLAGMGKLSARMRRRYCTRSSSGAVPSRGRPSHSNLKFTRLTQNLGQF